MQLSWLMLLPCLQLVVGDGHMKTTEGMPMKEYGDYDECCPSKKIWGNPNPDMNGMFYLVGKGKVSPACDSPCIYMKKGDDDSQYCFAPSMDSQSQCVDDKMMGDPFQQLWKDFVPYYKMLPAVPKFAAILSYDNIALFNNDSINTDDCMGRPYVKWSKAISGHLEEDENPLYTVIQVDVSIQRNQTFIHWMKINIDGTDTTVGDENLEYTPTFAFRSCFNGTTNHGSPCPRYIIYEPEYKHVFVTLVMRQKSGFIEVEDNERQVGCNADLLGERLVTFDWLQDFVEKYDLVTEAGHFFQSPYTPIVDRLICLYTRCAWDLTGVDNRYYFPGNIIEGVNNGPECEPCTAPECDRTAQVDYVGLYQQWISDTTTAAP